MKYALRAVASALMLAGACALAVATCLAVLTALVVAVNTGGGWAMMAGIAVVAMIAAIGVGLLAARRRRRRPQTFAGVPVTSDEQPLLWVEVYRVAEGLGTRPPDELLLAPDANVTASENRTWLGLRPGVRRLQLGLPLLAGLTERQLRAAIAREFCSSWGPHSLGRVIHRGKVIIGRVVDSGGEESRVGRIVGPFGRAYVAVSGPVTRRHELEADRLSAELAGQATTSAALVQVAVLSKGWDAFVDGYIEPAAAMRRHPHDLFAGFACFLEEHNRRMELGEAAEEPASQRRSAYDSQPSLGDRLAAIASLPEDDLRDKSGRALDMLRNPDDVVHRVEESMFHESDFVPATWEDIVPEAGRAAAREDALQLARLGHEGGLGPTMSVETLIELMRHGFVDDMVRPSLAEDASEEVERQMAGRLVTGFLATAAIESGTASYRFSWAAPRQLVDDLGAVDDLPLLVDAALADQAEVSALELWLNAHRVGQDFELGADLGQAVHQGLQSGPAQSPGDPIDDSRQALVPLGETSSI